MPVARIVIFANGPLPDLERARGLLKPADLIVCADGGTRHAMALGLLPAVVIGDLDSLAGADRARLLAASVRLEQHPRDKDETDLELALQYAVAQRPAALLVVGAVGNRLDQTLGNLSLLTAPGLAGIECRLDDGIEEAYFCRGRADIRGRAGEVVSLVPWGGTVTGVHTTGLRWPLRDEALHADKTRGISNELLGESAQVEIGSGLLLIIHHRGP